MVNMLQIMLSNNDKNDKITAPDGTQARISRCTDQQVLPVSISMMADSISFSVFGCGARHFGCFSGRVLDNGVLSGVRGEGFWFFKWRDLDVWRGGGGGMKKQFCSMFNRYPFLKRERFK